MPRKRTGEILAQKVFVCLVSLLQKLKEAVKTGRQAMKLLVVFGLVCNIAGTIMVGIYGFPVAVGPAHGWVHVNSPIGLGILCFGFLLQLVYYCRQMFEKRRVS